MKARGLFALRAACVAALVVTGPSAGTARPADATLGARTSPPSDDLVRGDPPRAESVEVLSSEGGRARIRVRFERAERLPDRVAIDVDGERVLLARSDAERGAFVGTVPLDVRALAARQKDLDALRETLGRPLAFPAYRGRVKIGDVPLPPLDVERALSGGAFPLSAEWVAPEEIDAARSLVIVDPAVVNDPSRTFDPCTGAGTPMGKWTFGYLVQQMAGSVDPSVLVRDWLTRWQSDQTVNGDVVGKRPLVQSAILDPWPRTTPGGPLDLAKAPFRLLAIVNRIDLADDLVFGPGSAGEARFVFGAIAPPPSCVPLRFTVIVEYEIERSGCGELRAWARQWADLGRHPLGSPAYDTALAAITEQFARAGAAPSRPNGSALAQIRTNEIALADLSQPGESAWDMREFRLRTSGWLEPAPVQRTPRSSADRTAALAAFVNANAPAILADRHVVPDENPPRTPFLGGHARAQTGTYWTGPTPTAIATPDLRFHFSLNTCNGCHARETGTAFTHVSPTAPPGGAAPLSGFLTGVDVPDPETGAVRHFADLDRRRVKLAGLAGRSCLFELFDVPVEMVH